MRFTFENRMYQFSFRYGQRALAARHLVGKHQDTTTVLIKGPADTIIGTETVARHHNDPPNRNAARKAALVKTLQGMKASREFRTALWESYHARPGGIKAAKSPG